MLGSTRQSLTQASRGIRQLSTTPLMLRTKTKEGFAQFKEKQRWYQQDNGLKVHERTGPVRKAVYYGLNVSIVACLVYNIKFAYDLIVPPEN